MNKTCGNSKTLKFIGQHSIELYLAHSATLKILEMLDYKNILLFVPFIILSIALAIPIKFLSGKIIKGLDILLFKKTYA